MKVSLGAVLITMDGHDHVLAAVCFCECRLLDIEYLFPMTRNRDFPLNIEGSPTKMDHFVGIFCHPD